MSDKQSSLAAHEPSLHTIEMVCDRLGEMGLAVGPDTARDLVRAVLAAEAPRVDARLREVLDTALETIRVAAQAAMGVLATTSPAAAPAQRREKRHSAPHQAAHQAPPPRPEPKRARDDFDDEDRRPVFRRPRGR